MKFVNRDPRGSLDIQRQIDRDEDRRKSRDRWRMVLPGWAVNATGAVIFTLAFIVIWGMVEVWWG